MLGADLMVGADHRPLEQRPNALNGVGVNVRADVFLLAVLDGVMACDSVESFVGVEIVRVDGGRVRVYDLAYETHERRVPAVRDDAESDFASALGCPNHDR